RRAPVESGDEGGLAHVLDVEDDEATVPVADIEAIPQAYRVVTAVLAPRPRRRLAARRPLPRHPPPADFLRLRWIGEVEDHHDVADVAVLPRSVELRDLVQTLRARSITMAHGGPHVVSAGSRAGSVAGSGRD